MKKIIGKKFNIDILDDLRSLGEIDKLKELFDQMEVSIRSNEPIILFSEDFETLEEIQRGYIGSLNDLLTYRVSYLTQ
jgi:hypothetical protein